MSGVDVTRQGMAKIDKEIAEMMRKYYLGLIYRTNTESPISPWRVAAKHYWLHGVCWFKTLWDADRWPDKPTQDEGESDESYRERLEEWQGNYRTHRADNYKSRQSYLYDARS